IRRTAFPRSEQDHVGRDEHLGFGAGLGKGFLCPTRIAHFLVPPKVDSYWPGDVTFGRGTARSIRLSGRKFVIGTRKLAAWNEGFRASLRPIGFRSSEFASGRWERAAWHFGSHLRNAGTKQLRSMITFRFIP